MEKRLAKLIENVKGGSDSDFSELCEAFMPLMKAQVLKFFGDIPSEYDDRLQDSIMALYNAALSFDLTQDKVTFGLYAKICIRNRLVSIKRKEKKNSKKAAPYDAFENQMQETGARASREKLEDNEKVISKLSSYEKSVLKLYLDGLSYREIGLALNKSEKSVDNALYRIKSKLKKLI
ncbi:MAG: sigma-70 family RNA polymerase sigma factor [Clostridia bacterium]|nr:sigma-70 family RNA polymerase sigma factor [Clostridia bacterium]